MRALLLKNCVIESFKQQCHTLLFWPNVGDLRKCFTQGGTWDLQFYWVHRIRVHREFLMRFTRCSSHLWMFETLYCTQCMLQRNALRGTGQMCLLQVRMHTSVRGHLYCITFHILTLFVVFYLSSFCSYNLSSFHQYAPCFQHTLSADTMDFAHSRAGLTLCYN